MFSGLSLKFDLLTISFLKWEFQILFYVVKKNQSSKVRTYLSWEISCSYKGSLLQRVQGLRYLFIQCPLLAIDPFGVEPPSNVQIYCRQLVVQLGSGCARSQYHRGRSGTCHPLLDRMYVEGMFEGSPSGTLTGDRSHKGKIGWIV